MVAIIKTGRSISKTLNYNENKVKHGLAECIGEGNYPMDVHELSVQMKLNRLKRQADLNRNVIRNSIHITLNFDPSEESLSKEELLAISSAYMEKIGFGEQPYLVYQHFDAAHPHLHLVSIKVKADGSRVDMYNLVMKQSEKVRQEIEKAFGLVVAKGRRQSESLPFEKVSLRSIQYGKTPSKRALGNILNGLLDTYSYTSLPELNALLNQYNVWADRGGEGSNLIKYGGLLYWILDNNGRRIGKPIKASDFVNRPTLKNLEQKFNNNKRKRIPFGSRIRNRIDYALMCQPTDLDALRAILQKQGIHLTVSINEAGAINDIIYVDHHTKTIFHGNALGQHYSAANILERCHANFATYHHSWLQDSGKQSSVAKYSYKGNITSTKNQIPQPTFVSGISLHNTFTCAENMDETLPFPFKRPRKKKKKKLTNHNT